MYRIVNDRIYLTRGETPTYNVRVINKETGAPFTISPHIKNPIVEFVVRPSVYARESEFVFKAYLDFESMPRFASNTPEYVDVAEWDEIVSPETEVLYCNTHNGDKVYKYWNGTTWIDYEFRLLFQFPYWATSVMEPKTYSYQVTLLGGTLRTDSFNTGKELIDEQGDIVGRANSDVPIVIDYNKPLLDPTDFIVGGSVSE